MSDKFLIYGCGELAWAQRASTPFGDDWITGRLEELLLPDPIFAAKTWRETPEPWN